MKQKINYLTILVILFICGQLEGWSWTRKINGTARQPEDVSAAVNVTSEGDVFASGMLEMVGTGKDFVLVKLRGTDGQELWRRIINGPANLDDYAGSVVVDSQNNPFVIGNLEQIGGGKTFVSLVFDGTTGDEAFRWEVSGTRASGRNEGNDITWDRDDNVISGVSLDNVGTGLDFGVLKHDAITGEELWRVEIDGTASSDDATLGVIVDNIGQDVYACGFLTNVGTNRDMFAIRINGITGEEMWSVQVNGTANGDDEAYDLGSDFFGDYYIVGKTANTGSGNDFTVVKHNGITGDEVWRQTIDGTAHDDDQAQAIVMDPLGNPIAGGFLTNLWTGRDFTVIKFDRLTGAELWRYSLNGTAQYSTDEVVYMEIDLDGNPIVTGFVTNEGTGEDLVAVKINGQTGAEVWRKVIDGTAHRNDRGRAVFSDRERRHAFISGMINNRDTGEDMIVLKLDRIDGHEIWRKTFNGTAANSADEATQLTVTTDSRGDSIAGGRVHNSSSERDFIVAKFNGANGAELWNRVIDGAAHQDDAATSVSTDTQGNVLASGLIRNRDSGPDLFAVKLNGATGGEMWRRVLSGSANGYNDAQDGVVDAQNNFIVAGTTKNVGTGQDFTIVKFNGASGAEMWRRNVNGTANKDDQATTVTVDGQGNPIAGGYTMNTRMGQNIQNFTVVKFNGQTGAELWRTIVPGTGGDDWGQASRVRIDNQGNVFAVGWVTNNNAQQDFVVVKINGITGNVLWRKDLNGTASLDDRALAVVIDNQGNPIAGGFTNNWGTGPDFTVVKFSGATGNVIWRKDLNGSAVNADDEVYDLVLDGQMNVTAVGELENQATGRDLAMIKFNGANGNELWRVVLNGNINRNDWAYSVSRDQQGNPIAVGLIVDRDRGGTLPSSSAVLRMDLISKRLPAVTGLY